MSIPPSKDIPPARRQAAEIPLEEINNLQLVAPKKRSRVLPLTVGILLLAGVGSVGYWQKDWIQPRLNSVKGTIEEANANLLDSPKQDTANAPEQPNSTSSNTASSNPTSSNTATEQANSAQAAERTPQANATAVNAATSANPTATETTPDQLLNHRRYDVRETDKLVPLNPNSSLRLAPDAQKAVSEMIAKAKAEGVPLGVISGFRTLEDQNYLYFDLKAERGQSAQARAEVSAPPGYSEHHTGYAVDFIDESKSNTHLEESFETTAAFRWLEKNAAFFNFEMSFPKNNEANVSYEPWHWRYVGNQESLELFYK